MIAQSQLEREIREQPGVVARLLADGRGAAEAFAAQVRAFAPRYVILAARGSSDNAARYAKYLFGVHNALSVGLAAPALFTIYHRPPRLDGALVIGVSQSGQSPDIVAVVEEARRQGALTAALTNDPGSPLALAASTVLPLRAGEEHAVAATKTYTSQLVLFAMLSAAIAEDEARWRELAALPDAMTAALDALVSAQAHAPRFAGAQRFVVLARGYNHATACEIALKIKETSYLVAEPYSWADFLHGPVAMVEEGFPVLLVAPSGAVGGDVIELMELLSRRGATIAAVSDRADVLARAVAPLALPAGVPEWLSPIVAAIPGQLFALALAQARGLDPDRPRGLSKVTLTT